ncbi:SKI family transcriptional corepressor 1 homolog-B-like isoform X1 [Salvelinus fontinalis]|uniref:SKI family transcriptional corepressor 1 homolog-B-like isoform X1 n=1 Tax=Salvelinus fontinalis TaxID=8038 RepID=UPI002485BFC8|nr:SKI family transcriptional corepressor 1 homolog-B-like isoform X1 [Salvelinus fontinalis]
MESNPSLLPVTRDSSSSPPSSKQDLPTFNPNLKPNQVSETALYGIPIVCLVLDGQERLCLAQISNTLLKNYSYNEIHNRRVALGITCVQCTPVQLEILRRAGAMPISSRRCGMITKREAERLCKSFLGAHNPPKLPENFAFDVSHECAWGSRGNFIPARYNSSRAKCIKCSFCNMYFSPNKFIFHSHRTPESKYTQPDAANFNSWRRHLKLTDKGSPDDVAHAWEDVKAMFNGGSRKRTLPVHGHGSERSFPLKPHQGPSNLSRRDSPEIPPKILRCEDNRGGMGSMSTSCSYPVIPVPSKSFGMLQNVKIPPPLYPHPYGFPAFGLLQKKDDGAVMGEGQNKAHLSGVFSWPSTKDSAYHSFPMFWPTAGGLTMPPYPQPQHKPHSELLCARQSDLDASEQSDRSSNTPRDSLMDSDQCSSTQSTRNEDDKFGDEARLMDCIRPVLPRKISYVSAFRPVIKDAESIAKLYGNRGSYNGARAGYLSPDFLSESSSYRSMSPGSVDSVGETDVDVETNKSQEDEESLPHTIEVSKSPLVPVLNLAQDASLNCPESKSAPEQAAVVDSQRMNLPLHVVLSLDRERQENKTTSFVEIYSPDRSDMQQRRSPYAFGSATNYHKDTVESKDDSVSREEPSSTMEEIEAKSYNGQSGEESPRVAPNEGEATHNVSRVLQTQKDIEKLAKEELQRQLVEQVEQRKKLEREFQHLKNNFHHQMKRELSYREEMVQQLHIVREAHDALQHFSCKMLTPRHCTGTCSFKPPR